MKKIIVAAVADNRAIGRSGELPWHLPADLAFFRQTIKGAFLLTGRKSYESEQGQELFRNRPFIVVTRQKDYIAPGALIAHDLPTAFALAERHTQPNQSLCILGGAAIYAAALPSVDELVITEVHTVLLDADAFFPAINPDEWTPYRRENHMADAENEWDYSFVWYHRRSQTD